MRTPHERLRAFLYILTRDHLPIGVIDGIIEALRLRDMADLEDVCRRKPLVEALASDWADRLIGKEDPAPEYRFGVFSDGGSLLSMEPWLTAMAAETARPAGCHVRRGRVVEVTTSVDDKIEWEDSPI